MDELQTLIDAIKNLTDIDEKELTDALMPTLLDNIKQQFNPQLVMQSVNQIITNFEDQGLTKVEVREATDGLIATLKEVIYSEEEFTGNKKVLIDTVLEQLFDVFNQAVEKYHSYAIELPITLSEGAKTPTYAHDTDAAADLYALEDVGLDPHTYGHLVHTGVKIQLPEGWLALVLPRSGMSMKTPLRVSNAPGLIDSGYRGEIGVLMDNISDEYCSIQAGDRIAQLLVMPNYRFLPKVVDTLTETDRGEHGFGSSGT